MNSTIAILFATVLVTSIVAMSAQIAAASDEAIVQIDSNTKWSGSILDSSFDSATQEGMGDATSQ